MPGTPENPVFPPELNLEERALLDSILAREGGREAISRYLAIKTEEKFQPERGEELEQNVEQIVDLTEKLKQAEEEIRVRISTIDDSLQSLALLENEKGVTEQIASLQKERKFLTRDPAYLSNSPVDRMQMHTTDTRWSIGGELKSDRGAYMRGVSFGVGNNGDRRYVVIRRLNMSGPGNRPYPHTFCVDPGEATWKAYEYNGARLAYNIMKYSMDPAIRDLWVSPDRIHTKHNLEEPIKKIIKDSVIPAKVDFFRDWQEALSQASQQDGLVGVKVDSHDRAPHEDYESMVSLIESLPIQQRKELTWVRGSLDPKAFGAKVVID